MPGHTDVCLFLFFFPHDAHKHTCRHTVFTFCWHSHVINELLPEQPAHTSSPPSAPTDPRNLLKAAISILRRVTTVCVRSCCGCCLMTETAWKKWSFYTHGSAAVVFHSSSSMPGLAEASAAKCAVSWEIPPASSTDSKLLIYIYMQDLNVNPNGAF